MNKDDFYWEESAEALLLLTLTHKQRDVADACKIAIFIFKISYILIFFLFSVLFSCAIICCSPRPPQVFVFFLFFFYSLSSFFLSRGRSRCLRF